MLRTPISRVVAWLEPWLLPAAIVLLWQLSASANWLPPTILPGPSSVWQGTLRLVAEGSLQENLLASAGRAATGFLIGTGAGFVLAVFAGLFPLWGNALNPTLQVLRNIPHLGVLPLLILIFGFGEETKLIIVSLGAFVPIYLNTYAGIAMTDRRFIELARTQRLSRFGYLRDIVLPGALPSIFTGLRFSLGVAWITLIVAESFSVDPGIGYMARYAREHNQTEIVILSMLIYAVLGKLTDLTVRGVEMWALPWHANFAYRKANTR